MRTVIAFLRRSRKGRQSIAAVLFLIAVIVAGASGAWPFGSAAAHRGGRLASLTQIVVEDRLTRGLVRLAIGMGALLVATSVPPLLVAGRWIKGFGTTGVAIDDLVTAPDLNRQLEEAFRERDQFDRQLIEIRRELDQAIRRMAVAKEERES